MHSLVPNELDVQMDADGTLQERGQRLQFGEPSLRAVHRSTLKLALQYFDLLLIEGSVAPWNDEPKARAAWRRKLCEPVSERRPFVPGKGEPPFILNLNVNCHGAQPTAKRSSVTDRLWPTSAGHVSPERHSQAATADRRDSVACPVPIAGLDQGG